MKHNWYKQDGCDSLCVYGFILCSSVTPSMPYIQGTLENPVTTAQFGSLVTWHSEISRANVQKYKRVMSCAMC